MKKALRGTENVGARRLYFASFEELPFVATHYRLTPPVYGPYEEIISLNY